MRRRLTERCFHSCAGIVGDNSETLSADGNAPYNECGLPRFIRFERTLGEDQAWLMHAK